MSRPLAISHNLAACNPFLFILYIYQKENNKNNTTNYLHIKETCEKKDTYRIKVHVKLSYEFLINSEYHSTTLLLFIINRNLQYT